MKPQSQTRSSSAQLSAEVMYEQGVRQAVKLSVDVWRPRMDLRLCSSTDFEKYCERVCNRVKKQSWLVAETCKFVRQKSNNGIFESVHNCRFQYQNHLQGRKAHRAGTQGRDDHRVRRTVSFDGYAIFTRNNNILLRPSFPKPELDELSSAIFPPPRTECKV
jgi:hypothetical protein